MRSRLRAFACSRVTACESLLPRLIPVSSCPLPCLPSPISMSVLMPRLSRAILGRFHVRPYASSVTRHPRSFPCPSSRLVCHTPSSVGSMFVLTPRLSHAILGRFHVRPHASSITRHPRSVSCPSSRFVYHTPSSVGSMSVLSPRLSRAIFSRLHVRSLVCPTPGFRGFHAPPRPPWSSRPSSPLWFSMRPPGVSRTVPVAPIRLRSLASSSIPPPSLLRTSSGALPSRRSSA